MRRITFRISDLISFATQPAPLLLITSELAETSGSLSFLMKSRMALAQKAEEIASPQACLQMHRRA